MSVVTWQSWRSSVIGRSVTLSFCEQDDGRLPNMVGMVRSRGDPQEVVNFWW